jgi:mono/diheme cytochrome c family protein
LQRLMASIALAAALFAASPAAAETFTPGEERQEDYPEAPGREQTFYACIACHGFKLVAQQGQTRQQWDDTLNWMTKRHGMPPIDGDLRKTVLDYLETAFPPRTAPGGWKNPFSGQ